MRPSEQMTFVSVNHSILILLLSRCDTVVMSTILTPSEQTGAAANLGCEASRAFSRILLRSSRAPPTRHLGLTQLRIYQPGSVQTGRFRSNYCGRRGVALINRRVFDDRVGGGGGDSGTAFDNF